jgi:YhcN/YlaJ family sporulation lipoprotein
MNMLRILGVLICAAVMLSACNTNKNSNMESQEETKQIKNTKSGRDPNSQIDTPLVERKSEEVHQSKDLVNLTEGINGVSQAYVIVSGLYTLVGIEPVQKVNPGEENEPLRKKVYDVLKENAHGRNAAITTDPDKIKQIKQLGSKIEHGKRHQLHRGVYNDLGYIISQIKPVKGQYQSTERQDMHENTNMKRSSLYE